MSTIIGQEKKDTENIQDLAQKAVLKRISDEIHTSINYIAMSALLCAIAPINKGELLKIFGEQLAHGIEQVKANPHLIGLTEEAQKAININETVDNIASNYFSIVDALLTSLENAEKSKQD